MALVLMLLFSFAGFATAFVGVVGFEFSLGAGVMTYLGFGIFGPALMLSLLVFQTRFPGGPPAGMTSA
ncbi:hypothetical protein [Thalassovita sp.]|uniref:hypothetical protein n=1 Tax=Thalassovita sp. TaxID=1979401 RepID=UPI002882D024|nr:hypothetical protein [Thalassovita sp.]MDF1803216.1 hypothetical protein [Thalassovita sp.]